jgi:hypothetical protein
MKHCLWLSASILACVSVSSVCGDIVFSQDFSQSTSVSAYADALSPDSGQWNSLVGGIIQDGGLQFTRGSSFGGFTRSTDFAPELDALIYRFDVNVFKPTSKMKNVAVWQAGSGFSPALNGRENNSKVHSQFAINFDDKVGGYAFRDVAAGTDYTTTGFLGKMPITWVINNSSQSLEYMAPNRTLQTIGTDEWDLWCGFRSMFLGSKPTSADVPITDLKFAFTAGEGTIWMDNFSIEHMAAVPEPAATGVISAALLTVFALASRVRRRGGKAPGTETSGRAR